MTCPPVILHHTEEHKFAIRQVQTLSSKNVSWVSEPFPKMEYLHGFKAVEVSKKPILTILPWFPLVGLSLLK